MMGDEALAGMCERRNELIGEKNKILNLFPHEDRPSQTISDLQTRISEVSLAIAFLRREIDKHQYATYTR